MSLLLLLFPLSVFNPQQYPQMHHKYCVALDLASKSLTICGWKMCGI